MAVGHFALSKWAWSLDLPGPRKLVLLALVEHAGQDARCWPSQARLVQLTGLSRSTVSQAVLALEEDGLVDVDRTQGRGSIYTLRPDREPVDREPVNPRPDREPVSHPTGSRSGPDREPVTEQTKNSPGEQPTGGPPKRARKRDLLFEAVIAATGQDLGTLTKPARGVANRAVKELREVGATPEQVSAAARRWRQEFPNATLTPSALSKHWSKLQPKVAKQPTFERLPQQSTTCPLCLQEYYDQTEHDRECPELPYNRARRT